MVAVLLEDLAAIISIGIEVIPDLVEEALQAVHVDLLFNKLEKVEALYGLVPQEEVGGTKAEGGII